MWKKIKEYKWLILAFIVLVSSVFLIAQFNVVTDKPYENFVNYSDFKKELDAGNVAYLIYSPYEEIMEYVLFDEETKGMTLDERSEYYTEHSEDIEMYKTYYPANEDFRKDIVNYDNVLISVQNESQMTSIIVTTVVQLGLLVLFFLFMYKVVMRMNGIGQIKEEDVIQKTDIKFSNVIGQDEVIEDIRFIVSLMKDSKIGEKTGARVPKGILFSGSPGTGKTLIAKAIAGEADVPFVYINGSSVIELYVGLGAKRIRDIFKIAKKHKPCIIFIDELDAIGGTRNSIGNSSEDTQTLNALLQEMDGFDTESGIFVIGATNLPDKLDKALLRAGRFDRKVIISPPKDWKVRKQLFDYYLKDKPVADDVNTENLSKQLPGFTGADIESVVNEAALITAMHFDNYIKHEYIEEAIDKVVFKGNRRKDEEMNHDKEIVAYHEAGHAVMSYLLGVDIARASIIGSTSGVGGAVFNTEEDSQFMTNVDFKNRIQILYSGRASESIKFGLVTTGASNDITQATSLIKQYVQKYGFDDEFGLLDINVLDKYVDTDKVLKKYSKLSTTIYNETYDKLKENYNLVELLSKKLLEVETLQGNEIKELFEGE